MRKRINLEFQVQMLLTAEIIAEAYYDLLRQRVADPVIHQACIRILKDEIGHLGFHVDFFNSWTSKWPESCRMLLLGQFQAILVVTRWVVWSDHCLCFKKLGVSLTMFFKRFTQVRKSLMKRTFVCGYSSLPQARSSLDSTHV